MDECDERVGEMEAETATAAAEYLHVELERLKATMQSCCEDSADRPEPRGSPGDGAQIHYY